MNVYRSSLWISLILIVVSTTAAFAQKTKVGYDKSVNFAQYKNYTVAEPAVPPSRPLLYASIVGSIDHELASKGLTRKQKDADLVLVLEGGTEFGLNQSTGTPISPSFSGPPPAINATMWTGSAGYSASAAIYVPEGTIRIDVIDRAANEIVWGGTVKVKLDIERKSKSLALIDKAVIKLLKQFPPKKS